MDDRWWTDDPLLRELVPIVRAPTGRSSAGYPYLARPAWARLRDWVPHVLGAGLRVWHATDRIASADPDGDVGPALQVVRQVVNTAAITAPPDLWLLHHVLAALARAGWLGRLVDGLDAVPDPLRPDVTLLLARGYLVRTGVAGVRWSDEPTAHRVRLAHPPPVAPIDLSARWRSALAGAPTDLGPLADAVAGPIPDADHPAPAWVATPEDLALGARLVPIVLGLRAADRVPALLAAARIDEDALRPLVPALAERVLATLTAAGWVEGHALTAIGRRALVKGPGPFGIIEAYHPYVAALPALWAGGGRVHVARAANVAASQDANRATFERANDALDRYCADTGFRYTVFVEHAVGRGEAIRQRYARSGDAVAYVGADLEPAAIDAARAEVAAGRLPAAVRFVEADIADPGTLVRALQAAGLDPARAVMVVGNGFHEVRDRTDARMIEVFRGYAAAGITLLLTEETALSVDDLLRTAWNTYHASFRYVHERSGQGLRPQGPSTGAIPGLGPPLPTSWVECATRAGYVELRRYGSRSRTIYPYRRADGHNPSISANLFLVPPDRPQEPPG
ncbi:MAG: hypothetical protein ABMB14_33935 [Myxococcota bacterium]